MFLDLARMRLRANRESVSVELRDASDDRVLEMDAVRDPRRVAAVHATGLLDTDEEPRFDDLTRLAAELVGAPFAFATLVDHERCFWKSHFGVDGPVREKAVEESFCQYVVRAQSRIVVNDALADEMTLHNPTVKAMDVRAWVGFPLTAPGGEVLGSLCLLDTRPRIWTERDLDVLETLAGAASQLMELQATVARERIARKTAETLVTTLQAGLRPPVLPQVAGLDLAVRFHPAGAGTELAGDFYDVFQTSDGTWGFIVGDVCGKGVAAAQVAAFALHTVSAVAMQTSSPASILKYLNRAMFARTFDADMFLTAVCGTFAIGDDAVYVTLACAGHPPPIVRRSDGRTKPIAMSGNLIGSFANVVIEDNYLQLDPGDAMIVLTDGVLEARGRGGFIDESDVFATIESGETSAGADAIAERIERIALQFCDESASDDIAVLVVMSAGRTP